MNSRTLLVLLPLAAMAAALAACSGPKTTFTTSSIETTGVTVSGHGEVEMTPDTGFFTVGVEVHAKSVAEARDGAARAADKVIASLKSNKVDEKDIKTSGLSINPQYDYNKNGGQPTIVGYIVSNTVEVKVRKLDSFSKLVDDAASAGGDNVRLQGVRFALEDDTKAVEQARESAMADAKKKAEQLAKAGGVSLGKPASISEQQAQPGGDLAQGRFAAANAQGFDATPIQPGTGKVTIDVVVRYSLN